MSLPLFDPGPRPLRLSGSWYLGLPLRVGDLFGLARLAAELDPAPAVDWADPAAVAAEYDRAQAGAGPEWTDALAYAGGTLLVVRSVLRGEGLGDDEAEALHDGLTGAEWAEVWACAARPEPFAVASAAVDRLAGVEDLACGGVPWSVAVAEVAETLGKTLGELWEVTLPEVRLHRQGGAPTRDDAEAGAEGMRRRRRWWEGYS